VEQIDLPFTEPVRANPGTQWKEVITLRRLAEKGELIAQARPGEYKSNTWYSSFNGLFLHPPPPLPLLPSNSQQDIQCTYTFTIYSSDFTSLQDGRIIVDGKKKNTCSLKEIGATFLFSFYRKSLLKNHYDTTTNYTISTNTITRSRRWRNFVGS
jgi:hypothetical protein